MNVDAGRNDDFDVGIFLVYGRNFFEDANRLSWNSDAKTRFLKRGWWMNRANEVGTGAPP